MRRTCLIGILGLVLLSWHSGWAQDTEWHLHFSESTNEENQVTLQGPGFGEFPLGEVTYGEIPTDQAFEGSTDGQGLILHAEPGQGVMIFGPVISASHAAFLRCSVRTDAPHASIILASIDQGSDVFISTITPNNGAFFLNRYRRLADIVLPPSVGFLPLLQILNTSQTEPLTVYVDNWDIFLLNPENYYQTRFLQGDETDPARWSVSESDLIEIPVPPTPTPTLTPTATPTPVVPTPTPIIPSENEITVALPNLASEVKPLHMVFLEPGTFMMGSPSDEIDRDSQETRHEVILTRGFYMGKYEVTQAQWEAVMGSNPSYFSEHPDYPVESVSWTDCQTFLQKLNQLNLGSFRLPSEAEWEYACRAGTQTRFYWGDDPQEDQIGDYAWYGKNAENTIHEVGFKQPNAWNLFDMSGNVHEWCQDWFDDYPTGSMTDPTGPESGVFKVRRGGSWLGDPSSCRSAYRIDSSVTDKAMTLGFRLVMDPN